MKFLVMGSLNYDYTYVLDHIVKPGETAASVRMETACGGKGFNQAAALAKAGACVYLAGITGADGGMLRKTAEQYGVDCTLLKQGEGKTGHAMIQLDKKGQNSILLFGGTNRMWTAEYIEEVLSGFGKGDILVLQNEINGIADIIKAASQKGLEIVLNPSPFEENILEYGLDKVSLFLLNEVEGEQMTGSSDAGDILGRLEQKYPRAAFVLTLGEKGAYYAEGGRRLFEPAVKAVPVDTTAAGDTFTGYFLEARAKGMEARECLHIAAAAAALTVSRQGASASIPLWDEATGCCCSRPASEGRE